MYTNINYQMLEKDVDFYLSIQIVQYATKKEFVVFMLELKRIKENVQFYDL